MTRKLKAGEKVTFDSDRVSEFIKETSGENSEIKKYQQLVLSGVNQIGVVKSEGPGENLTTISYPDGWDLPVPTKYLILLP